MILQMQAKVHGLGNLGVLTCTYPIFSKFEATFCLPSFLPPSLPPFLTSPPLLPSFLPVVFYVAISSCSFCCCPQVECNLNVKVCYQRVPVRFQNDVATPFCFFFFLLSFSFLLLLLLFFYSRRSKIHIHTDTHRHTDTDTNTK